MFGQASKKPYHHYNDFLDAVENYETELEEHRVNEARKIAAKYLTKIKTGTYPILLLEIKTSTYLNGEVSVQVCLVGVEPVIGSFLKIVPYELQKYSSK